jgi:hypothetical protein
LTRIGKLLMTTITDYVNCGCSMSKKEWNDGETPVRQRKELQDVLQNEVSGCCPKRSLCRDWDDGLANHLVSGKWRQVPFRGNCGVKRCIYQRYTIQQEGLSKWDYGVTVGLLGLFTKSCVSLFLSGLSLWMYHFLRSE